VETIYFDNAATSWPKPPAVAAALADHYQEGVGNPGRSGHRMSIAAARVVEDTREALATLFNGTDPGRIVFTHNATHALNLAIHGVLRPGDHAITTSIEHNSVMRPLRHLETTGVELTVVPCARDGTLDVDEVRRALRSNTRLLVTTHASNVIGTLLPVEAIAGLARERGIRSLVDASQTAGAIPIDVQRMGVDLLAFPGHKALLGPTGTGGLYIRDGVTLAPLVRGGTGSESASEVQPAFLPDTHESGTLNVAGIAGLHAAVAFLRDVGIDAVRAHEQRLVARFLEATLDSAAITVHGTRDAARQCGVVSFSVAGATPSEVGLLLDESFGIMARAGLHCAPAAHRTIDTFPDGTVRFGFGWFNTLAEIDASIAALRQIARWTQPPVIGGGADLQVGSRT
jgi:cysteine desulfurase family protein